MKIYRLLLLFLLSTGALLNCFSNDFIINDFSTAPSDLTARTQKKFTINEDPCAVLKIRSDIEGVKFDARNGVVDVSYKNGEYLVYISPGERKLYIMKDGFLKKEYQLPIAIEPLAVYKMELTGSDTYPIIISTTPENIPITIDGKAFQSNQTIPDFSPGSHALQIEYPGYREVIDTFYVSKNNISFKYILESLTQIPVRIISHPNGANAMINNIMEGTTPTEVFVFPGKIDVLLTKSNYQPLDTTLTITDTTTVVHLNLRSTTGLYKLGSTTPGIHILVDNKPAKEGVNIIAEGRHTLKASAEGYDNFDTIFTIKRGEEFRKQINLTRQTGTLQITAKPFETEFELITETYNSTTGKASEIIDYTWAGSKLLESVPTGKYILRAKYPGHETQEKEIVIEKNKTTRSSVELLQVFVQTGSHKKAVIYSAILPGSGQLYSQQKRGWIYMPLFVGSLGASAILHSDVKKYNDAREAYLNATTDIGSYRIKMDETYDKAEKSAKTRNLLVYTAGAIYLTSLIDALIFGGIEVKQQSALLKQLDNINLTCIPVQGVPTFGFIYTF